jgi:hypothetical protein
MYNTVLFTMLVIQNLLVIQGRVLNVQGRTTFSAEWSWISFASVMAISSLPLSFHYNLAFANKSNIGHYCDVTSTQWQRVVLPSFC